MPRNRLKIWGIVWLLLMQFMDLSSRLGFLEYAVSLAWWNTVRGRIWIFHMLSEDVARIIYLLLVLTLDGEYFRIRKFAGKTKCLCTSYIQHVFSEVQMVYQLQKKHVNSCVREEDSGGDCSKKACDDNVSPSLSPNKSRNRDTLPSKPAAGQSVGLWFLMVT